jgi:hypothetical protein
MNKRQKKLTLSRESLRNLTEQDTRQVAGGSLGQTNTVMPSHCLCTLDLCSGASGGKQCY